MVPIGFPFAVIVVVAVLPAALVVIVFLVPVAVSVFVVAVAGFFCSCCFCSF